MAVPFIAWLVVVPLMARLARHGRSPNGVARPPFPQWRGSPAVVVPAMAWFVVVPLVAWFLVVPSMAWLARRGRSLNGVSRGRSFNVWSLP